MKLLYSVLHISKTMLKCYPLGMVVQSPRCKLQYTSSVLICLALY